MIEKVRAKNHISMFSSTICDPSNLEILVQSILRRGRDRTSGDLLNIVRFLESTTLIKKLQKEKFDEIAIKRLSFFCSSNIEYEFIPKDQYLFKEGDKGDKFYVVIQGVVSVTQLKEKELRMTSEEYIIHLINLFKKKELTNFKKTIKVNKNTYFVALSDAKILEQILFKVKLRKVLNLTSYTPENYEILLEEFKNRFINFEPLEEDNYDNFSESKNYRKRRISHTPVRGEPNQYAFQFENYLYLENNIETKIVKIYVDEFLTDLHSGANFGNLALESKDNFRSASIFAKEDTHLGYIHHEIYNDHVFNEKQKITNKEVFYLIDNYFPNINFKVFKEKYYNFFRDYELQKNQTVLIQGCEIDKIYLIKEGELQIQLYVSVLELHQLIDELILKGSFEIKNPLTISKHELLLKDYNKRFHIKLYINGEKKILGLEEYFFKLNSLYYAQVFSNYAKFYRVTFKDFDEICEEKETRNSLYTKAQEKLFMLIQRMIELKQFYISEIKEKNIVTQNKQQATSNYNFLKNFAFSVNDEYTNKTRNLRKKKIDGQTKIDFSKKIKGSFNFDAPNSLINNSKEFSVKSPEKSLIKNENPLKIPYLQTKDSLENKIRCTRNRIKSSNTSEIFVQNTYPLMILEDLNNSQEKLVKKSPFKRMKILKKLKKIDYSKISKGAKFKTIENNDIEPKENFLNENTLFSKFLPREKSMQNLQNNEISKNLTDDFQSNLKAFPSVSGKNFVKNIKIKIKSKEK